MIDLRPVGYVLGLLIVAFGVAMGAPAAVDLVDGAWNWRAFAVSGALTVAVGATAASACRASARPGLTIQQTFALTVFVWALLPLFGALPLMIGEPRARLTDGYFEAMSGLTTTGSTVFSGLETLPRGALLWRAMMQWFGGVGIIVVALAFLPNLRVGGMQLFRSEAFDTFGKILPRAGDIAASVSWVYVGLTGLCAVVYAGFGMDPFDAVCHAMTTIALGGFANSDASFSAYPPAIEYAAAIFMLLAALPFVRYVQLVAGTPGPLFRDTQIRAFFWVAGAVVLSLTLWRLATAEGEAEAFFRRALFNGVSILTGTGYASEDYGLWGGFAATVVFIAGLVGGCAGSATCAIKVFRFQVLIAAVDAEVRTIHSPSGVFIPRFDGRPVEPEAISSVMSFLYLFALTLGLVTVALAMMGLDPVTAISGAATALANVGPGLGPVIGPAGNFAPLPDGAKWVLSLAMLLGRLEVLTVLVLLTPGFWRR
ncbi:MAG: TrkH family potassium uptake protein [Rhodobacteraceae bacterium]|nr:MAG: TrkH family potassium uptake protein [Paracoccaceae bacterium]